MSIYGLSCTKIHIFLSLSLDVRQRCNEYEPLMTCFTWALNMILDMMNIS